MHLPESTLLEIYRRLFAVYGPQHWWPADTPFEIMLGAVLTQNTAWTNVERAIGNLKSSGLLDLRSILEMEPDVLAQQIRPSGYYNIKARRLLSLCRFLEEHPALEQLSDGALRQCLLSVHGIGPETADDILLYAYNRPVFVIDAYTRRLFSRLGLVQRDVAYEAMRQGFEQALGPQTALFNEYHALIVRHAKTVCGNQPHCDACCLMSQCERRLVC